MVKKRKILVVEDETPVAMLIVHILTCAGFEVHAVHKGQKGMELAAEARFDLIVLSADLFGGISGFEMCGELRKRHISRHTPIVFISCRMSAASKQHGLELGVQDYIAKPFEADDFIFRIISLIERNHSNSVRVKTIEGIMA